MSSYRNSCKNELDNFECKANFWKNLFTVLISFLIAETRYPTFKTERRGSICSQFQYMMGWLQREMTLQNGVAQQSCLVLRKRESAREEEARDYIQILTLCLPDSPRHN